ncbi:MAG: helix-turn-helix transcriptional regulator [Verrucomicrobiota bacterium]|jgi:transcriptional regulator with XRE-family HTH domain
MATKDLAPCFAEVVRRHRKQIRMSQEKLAEKANLSSKMISLVERGERTPSLTVADSIAKGLSVPLWRLVKDAENLRRE